MEETIKNFWKFLVTTGEGWSFMLYYAIIGLIIRGLILYPEAIDTAYNPLVIVILMLATITGSFIGMTWHFYSDYQAWRQEQNNP